MVQLLGETREEMANATWNKAMSIAHDHKSEVKPFYIMYAGKVDPNLQGSIVNGLFAAGVIREAWRLSYARPPRILGLLVWFVNNPLGIFEFLPELSSPPDVLLDPSLLSDRKEDQSIRVMETGKNLNVLVS
jgi:hypothetical protein